MPFEKTSKNNSRNSQFPAGPQKIFVGRKEELSFFRDEILSPDRPAYNIISVFGQAGVGKSTLLKQFIDETRTDRFKKYCLSALVLVNEQQSSPVSIMEEFAKQLSQANFPLIEFERSLDTYRKIMRKLEVEQGLHKNTLREATLQDIPNMAGSAADSIPVMGRWMRKQTETFTGELIKVTHMKEIIKIQEKVKGSIDEMTRAFAYDLNQHAKTPISRRQLRLVLCFDIFDTIDQLILELTSWLLEHFLRVKLSDNIVLVLAGREFIGQSHPDKVKDWLEYAKDIYSIHLKNFSEDETRLYLKEYGIVDVARQDKLWQNSHGLPFYLGLWASNPNSANPNSDLEPTIAVVKNFLSGISEQESFKRQLVLGMALLTRSFNQFDLDAFGDLPASEDERAAIYRWLIRQSFVEPDNGRYRYHDMARELFTRHFWQSDPKKYIATRREFAKLCQRQLENIPMQSTQKLYYLPGWREISLELAYQLLLLPDDVCHTMALEQVLTIYDHEQSQEEIIQFLEKVMKFLDDIDPKKLDFVSRTVAEPIKQLQDYIKSDSAAQQEFLATVSASTVSEGLKRLGYQSYSSSRFLAGMYCRRGIEYKKRQEYEKAMPDFDRAIDLDDQISLFYSLRGDTYLQLNACIPAIKDFSRAIELEPDPKGMYLKRGEAHALNKDFEHAIGDFTHAIDLDANCAQAYNERGEIYYRLNQYKKAFEDFNSTLKLNSKDTQPLLMRGMTALKLKNYEHARRDFDQVLEQHLTSNSNPQIYYYRGIAHLWLGAVKKAHIDFAQSLQLAPADIEVAWMTQWTFMCLCEKLEVAEITHQLRSITTSNPQHYISYIWHGILRARTRWSNGLKMLEQAIEREPQRGDAFFWKAMICPYLDPRMEVQAVKALKMAQELALPPALFAPMHWLKQDRPDFYQEHILPLVGSGGEEQGTEKQM